VKIPDEFYVIAIHRDLRRERRMDPTESARATDDAEDVRVGFRGGEVIRDGVGLASGVTLA
jgi:hypothetical protein